MGILFQCLGVDGRNACKCVSLLDRGQSIRMIFFYLVVCYQRAARRYPLILWKTWASSGSLLVQMYFIFFLTLIVVFLTRLNQLLDFVSSVYISSPQLFLSQKPDSQKILCLSLVHGLKSVQGWRMALSLLTLLWRVHDSFLRSSHQPRPEDIYLQNTMLCNRLHLE